MDAVTVTLNRHSAWVTGASDAVYNALYDFYSYKSPTAFFAPSHRLWLANKSAAKLAGDPDREVSGWDGKIRLMYYDSGKLPAGLFRATKKDAEQELGIRFQVTYDRPPIAPFKLGFSETSEKYLFQNSCVDTMLGAMHKGGGVILSATATGKTRTASQLCSKLTCPVLFVVDRLDLLYQAQEDITKGLGEEVGIVGDSEFQPKRVTVGTIQTLTKHAKKPAFKKWYATVEVLLVDELHKAMAKSNFKLLQQIKPTAIFGLTATLQMKKKDVRYRVYSFAGPVLFRYPVKEAMEDGVVTKGRIVQILFPALDDESHDAAQAYREEVVEHPAKLLATRRIVKSLVDQGRYVMVMADRVAHVKDLDNILYDVPHEVAYGAIKQSKRREDRDRFEAGTIQCLIANRVYEKGVSIKRVDVGIDVAELPNPNDCIQKFGRLTRLYPNKDSFIYFDFGTYGASRRSKASNSRARAFRAEGLEVKVIKIKGSLKQQPKLAQQIVDKEIQRDVQNFRSRTSTKLFTATRG